MLRHDDQGNQKVYKYPNYLSNSLSREMSDRSSRTLNNSFGVTRSQVTVTDQTLWLWGTRLLQTEPCGISDRCCTREKSWATPSRQATLQTQVPHTSRSSLKASHMAFCRCFQMPSPAFSTEDRAVGSLLKSALRKGSPGATPFPYLYQLLQQTYFIYSSVAFFQAEVTQCWCTYV